VTATATTTGRAGVEVRLEELRRRYGTVTALDGLDLTLHPGELVALLGPSGCGKTTALRLLAGLEDLDGGRVLVDGKDLSGLPTNKRDMGMVFQAYSLFPHLTARENVAFGLRLRGVSAAERHRRAGEMLELVGLAAQADRYAHQMSGGQQQRVALARALAIQPTVLLLDEPLSALDAKVRAQLRDEIRRVQLEVGITTLFVTHDQEEALAIADRVGVMHAGRLEQLGAPTEVYHRPATAFVAEFVGLTNRLPAQVGNGLADVLGVRLPLVDPTAPAGPATALVRPEAITLTEHPEGDPTGHGDGDPAAHADGDPAGPLVGRVVATSFLGAVSRITVDLGAHGTVLAQLPTAEAAAYAPGGRARVSVRRDPVLVTPGAPAGGAAAAPAAAEEAPA